MDNFGSVAPIFKGVSHVFGEFGVEGLVFSFTSKGNASNCRHRLTTIQLADWTGFSCQAQLIVRDCCPG